MGNYSAVRSAARTLCDSVGGCNSTRNKRESRRSTGELTTAVCPIHNPALKQGFANRVRVFDRGQPDCVIRWKTTLHRRSRIIYIHIYARVCVCML